MTNVARDLFDRWERVWHEGQYDLVPSCIAENYVRHEAAGDRTVTRQAYAAELVQLHAARPNLRVVVYDHAFEGDRAWFRFTFNWSDLNTAEPQSQAGMQSYRIEAGRLTETWVTLLPLGSKWSDKQGQERWTSPRT